MFNSSKYTKWYFTIIESAKSKERKKTSLMYLEKHHIIPRSFGGSNKKDNIVMLTAREHYIVHLILPKMCIDYNQKKKMVYAFFMMNKTHKKLRYNSKLYEIHRISYTKYYCGKHHPHFGKPRSEETRNKIRLSKIGVPRSPETIEKMRQANLGKTLTDEHKRKISLNNGKPNLGKTGNLSPMFGKHHSVETKEKCRQAKLGNKNPNYGKVFTQEEKTNLSRRLSSKWKITFPDGHTENILGLNKFCKLHNLIDSSFIRFGKCKGFTGIRL